MSVIATALEHMLAAGMDHAAIVEAVAAMESSAPKDRAAGGVGDKRRNYDRNRKALLRDGGFFAARASLFASQAHICTYCGTTTGPFHCDHVVPLSRGGPSDQSNLTISCAPCNLAKGASQWG